MCGIAGIFNRDGRPADRDIVTSMTRALAHRGPDGQGIWIDGAVGFGHRRLAIRDPGVAGHQPMIDSTGEMTVTFNGEIYNDRRLKQDLTKQSGRQFVTDCDTEMLTPAYRAWGTRAFGRFDGMFALALWDARKHELILARDAAGIKPLYYTIDERAVSFASEVKALLCVPRLDAAFSPESLHRFLAQGFPGPERSLHHSIHQLKPGAVLIVGRDYTRAEQWWRPVRTGGISDPREALADFEELWRGVVLDHLISDVPLGIFLSGGIDSALVAAALKGRAKVPAFTARFEEASHDEFDLARQTATAAGLSHVAVAADCEHDVEQTFRRVVHHFDGQCADSSGLALFVLCEAARRHVPVVLAGDGADEFFGGYPTLTASRLTQTISALVPNALAGALSHALAHVGRNDESRISAATKLARLLAGIATGRAELHPQWRRYLFADQQASLYGPAMRDLLGSNPLEDYEAAMQPPEAPLIDRCLIADQSYYLPGDMLLKVDNMSMAHGLEVRVPFLDHRVMSFAGRLDASLLSPLMGPTKKILRTALARAKMPPDVISGQKKGFQVPVARLLRTALKPLGDRLLDGEADVLAPFFDPAGVRNLWRAHSEWRANHGYVLWTLLTLATFRQSAAI